MNVQNALTDVL